MATPSTDWKESIPADEAERFAEYARRFTALQQKNAHGSKRYRALHAKSHRGFEASFEVLPDVPEHARHGLFAKAATYEAIVRWSNGSGAVKHDHAGDVRGMAVKVLGVDGEKVLGDARTQDFLGVLSPAIPFRTADEFVSVVWAMRSPPLAPFRIAADLGPRRAIELLRKLSAGLKAPPLSLAGRPFYSAAPIQCGPYAVRFRFRPEGAAAGADAPLADSPDAYGADLAARLREGEIVYTMSLQFFVDEARTPIEDASIDWAEDAAPYVDVARLVLTKQDASTARGRKLHDRTERLSFDPWHALTAHKPLGGIMRARKQAYYASAQGREAQAEPDAIASLLGG
jgi:hypothetical protein